MRLHHSFYNEAFLYKTDTRQSQARRQSIAKTMLSMHP